MTPILPQVKNIVMLMLENRSLDNLLGWLYDGDQPEHVFPRDSAAAYDGLVAGRYFNPAKKWTGKIERYPVVPVPDDLGSDLDRVPAYDPYEPLKEDDHWNGVMNQLYGDANRIAVLPNNDGPEPGMLGFLQDYYSEYMLSWKGLDILWAYTPSQMPVINWLARNYAVSDQWFCSVPSQTNPNRAFSLCGTSLGRESNLVLSAVEQFDATTVFNELATAGKSWGLYFTDVWKEDKSYTEYTFPWISQAAGSAEVADIPTFMKRAHDGQLPQFTYLEPAWGYGKGALYKQGTDYHPPTRLSPGEQFLADVYHAIRQGPQWNETLFVVTFDEHGGTYDHRPPPKTINPGSQRGASGFNFDRLGVRVPTILVSPFVEAGTVFRAPDGSAHPFDHTSLLKTLLMWAGVDPGSAGMGARMPVAPTFEGVLADDHVNVSAARPEAVAAVAADPDEGMVNHLLEGVSFAATKAIVEASDDVAAVEAGVSRYRADPEAFEASLGAG